jgi:topoisomerase (DNA) II binding protein 1
VLYIFVVLIVCLFCLKEGSLQDVGSHILFSPLKCRVPLPGFEKLKLCFSLYDEKDKFLLKNLCFTLGAKFSDKITKKMTHLVCKFASGPKYEFSIKRGIEVVTAEWMFECVARVGILLFKNLQKSLLSYRGVAESPLLVICEENNWLD